MSEAQLPKYRAYWLDGSGHFLNVDWVDAQSDDEAIAAVRATTPPSKCEIWVGHRLVTKFEPDCPWQQI